MLFLSFNCFSGTVPEAIGSLVNLTSLSISENSLYGLLPSSIGSLQKLFALVTHSNKFGPSVTPELWSLHKLHFLGLAKNCFSGTIPTIVAKLKNLVSLRLSWNNFSGDIPTEIYSMSSLSGLEVNNNPRLYGPVPHELGRLSNLGYLSFEQTGRFGRLPDSLANLTKLAAFQVDDNDLSGTLPTFLGLFRMLTMIDMDANRFYGTLPLEWSNLTNLLTFDVSSNQLNGTIPSYFLKFKEIEYLEFGTNSFSGQLPSGFGDTFAHLEYLNLKENMFTGLLPLKSISKLSTVEVFLANDNQFTGPIPDDFHLMRNLQIINIANNMLTGTIDASIGLLDKLKSFIINDNCVSGSIPSTIGKLTGLEVLVASSNRLTGTLPSSIGNLSNLVSIVLENNNLKGSADVFSSSQRRLEILDIADNGLTGTLPLSMFNHSGLISVSASKNCFRGEIPSEICELSPNLEQLVLDGLTSGRGCKGRLGSNLNVLLHRVTGTIPACLFRMSKLRVLYASGNGVEGEVGDIPSYSKLEKVKLSWNELFGTLPRSVQQHRFVELDVSKNKITGKLDAFDNRSHVEPGDIVKLNNNRFSGNIPNIFYEFDEINVLEGNLFDCTLGEDLPSKDPNHLRYICGSQAVNSAISVWVVSVVVALVVIAAGHLDFRLAGSTQSICSNLASALANMKDSIYTAIFGLLEVVDLASLKPGISALFPRVIFYYRIYSLIRGVVLRLAAIIIFVFLPIYTLISMLLNNAEGSSLYVIYENQYVSSIAILIVLLLKLSTFIFFIDLYKSY
jgi:Leucine-rich repeat (LRR) protein